MLNIIQSEHLKYKHSFSKKLVFIAPLFFVLYAVIVRIYIPSGEGTPWEFFICMVFNWWPLLFIPLGTALLCALAEGRERKAGNYRGLRVYNINPSSFWFGKIAVLAFYTLLSSVIMIFVVFFAGLMIAQGTVPFAKIVEASLVIWLISLSIIPIQLLAAAWKGAVAPVGLSILGMLAGVLSAPKSSWVFVPWSWPLRLMCPIIGVHPNGVPLEASDPLLNPSVIPPGIVISLVFFVITAILTAIWFSKREVR